METSLQSQVIFGLTALAMIGGALATVTAKNILHAALALIGTFLATAILYLELHAEFVALAQVMVYIGGVLIFTVFTILLTTRLGDKSLPTGLGRKFAALLLAGGIFSIFWRVLGKSGRSLDLRQGVSEGFADLNSMGERLLSPQLGGYLVAFEVISLLLLIAMIGAVVITRRPTQDEEEKQ
jgi:NADH-quinone oxidoreductase subunit J